MSTNNVLVAKILISYHASLYVNSVTDDFYFNAGMFVNFVTYCII